MNSILRVYPHYTYVVGGSVGSSDWRGFPDREAACKYLAGRRNLGYPAWLLSPQEMLIFLRQPA